MKNVTAEALWPDCVSLSVWHTTIVMVGEVYAVYKMTDRITITPCLFSVMPGGPQVWGFTGQVQVISASSWEWAHGQRVLLVNCVQLFGAHSVSDELKLL